MTDRPAILVTGGAGYIGSHCCRALVAAGYHPVAYDNLSTGHRSFVTGSLVTGDLLDKAALGITGLVLLGRGVLDAQTILIFDGSLAVITLVAYVLAKAYTAWTRLHMP